MSHMIKYILNCILDQIGKFHDGYEAQSSLYEYKKAKHAVYVATLQLSAFVYNLTKML